MTGIGRSLFDGVASELLRWIAMAEAAVEGDTLAVAAGLPARVIAITNADRALDLAQAAQAELRPQVDLLIRRIPCKADN